MIDFQRRLFERFSELRDARRGSIFFVEHGLRADELNELRGAVRASLQSHPLESAWWDHYDLPLLVSAAEVGYRYRGSGTDFWPLLEDELRVELPAQGRQRIKDLFKRATGRLRGARPPATAWAHAFHLISWPITHALLPVEFHRPFAKMLANLRASVGEADDSLLYRAICVAASAPSARFATLLGDVDLVVSLTRCLLGECENELSADIVGRLSDDLQADEVARRGLAVARRVQRTSRADDGPPPVPAVAELQGTLQLRRANSALMLEGVFPPQDPTTAARLRVSLRRRRFAPRLWGVTARVPSDQLLSGLPFPLKLAALPAPDSPLFPAPLLDGLEAFDLALLRNYQLRLTPPILFAVSADGETARQVRGTEATGHRRYWLLDREDAEFRDLCVIGEVGPLKCLEIDPKSDVGAGALAQLGYKVRFGVSLRFAGAPAIRREDPIPTFVVGEHCVLIPQRVSDEAALNIDVNGSHSLAGASDVVRIVVGEGDQKVKISGDTDAREYAFRGVQSAPPPSVPVRIMLRSQERTVQALFSGRLSFVVDSFAPLSGLELTVDLEAAGRRVSATSTLEPLPQVVSAEHSILDILRAEDVREFAAGAESLTLRARIGHLAAASWELERTVRPCWWEFHPVPSLLSEVGPLQFGVVGADDPIRAPVDRPPGDGAYLLAPVGLDMAEFGPAAPFTTLCLAPDRVQLPLPSTSKPRLARRRQGSGSSVGLEDLVDAYLRWSLAETRTALGELRRGQVTRLLDSWVTELCCGAQWSQEEERLDSRGVWALFERACCELKLGDDSYIGLAAEQYAEVRRLAVDTVRRLMPGLWARVGLHSDFDADDYDALDQAFASAYAELAEKYRRRGKNDLAERLGDADPGDAPDHWDQAFGKVQQTIEMRALAAMLLPSDCTQRFIGLDVGSLTVDEVADELTDWARASRMVFSGPPPTRDTLRTIYALWVEPELALAADWRGGLDTLLAERAVARATRYLAIKARNLRRGAT